jgi:thiamine-monophosphate kinase
MLNESDIIDFLQTRFPALEGIGDDAAILSLSDTESYVITKDLLIEDIHFCRKYCNAESLAHKALHVNLSDIAAMGAEPKYILLGISIPNDLEGFFNDFLKSFAEACEIGKVHLIGGDTTKSLDKLFISVTVIGLVKKTHIKLRKSARKSDIICVAGNLGDAHVGFQALEHNMQGQGLKKFKDSFLQPNSRIREGLWFGERSEVSAMMDISDGLFIDLKKMCRASKVAAEINLDNFEPSQEFKAACHALNLDQTIVQLTGGEDYGLLVSVNAESYQKMKADFSSTFGYALHPIGRIISGIAGEISFTQKGLPINIILQPFSHFGELS